MLGVEMQVLCPVCGYPGLKEEPVASFEICDCCGTEFGVDDGGLAGKELDDYHTALRAAWALKPSSWFNEEARPANWSLLKQLGAIKLRPVRQVRDCLRLIEKLAPGHKPDAGAIAAWENYLAKRAGTCDMPLISWEVACDD
jgi:hypothetical protein